MDAVFCVGFLFTKHFNTIHFVHIIYLHFMVEA